MGSSNLDDVALRHIYEMSLVVESKAFARQVLKKVFNKDLAHPKIREIKAADITVMQRMLGAFFGMFHDII